MPVGLLVGDSEEVTLSVERIVMDESINTVNTSDKEELLKKVASLLNQKLRRSAMNKIMHERSRIKVLKHYGGDPPRCACCGDSTYQFLGIDHIGGRGIKQRLPGGNKGSIRGSTMYWDIIRKGFPPGLRVLCHNCNMAIGFYGSCPHDIRRELDAILLGNR